MQCTSCGSDNREGVLFCENCGAKLERACAACGAALSPDARFCGACGHSVEADAPTPAPALQSERPERYTPSHLAERILGGRGALEGERKLVTILFADLKGSLEMIEGADPEQTQVILDSAVGAMMDAVHRYEGTVNKVLGDGIMAIFGAPLAHEDHAVRACYAALTLQKEMLAVAAETRRKHGVEVQTRVGLHHVCFRARSREDVDALHGFLQELGATIVHPPREDSFAPGYYSVLFEDPDGIRLEMNYVPGKGHLEKVQGG